MARRQHANLFTDFAHEATLVACAVILFLAGTRVNAGTSDRREILSQTREFAVSVDGTKRGTCRMHIRNRDDGTVWVQSDAELRINVIVYKYNYSSAGTEVWKNGQLIGLDNTSNFNGTRYHVKAAGNPANGLQLDVDGEVSPLEQDVWVTSYWRIPERFAEALTDGRNAKNLGARVDRDGRLVYRVSLLDSDQGKRRHGRLKRIGNETLAIMGTQRTCTHYRITGDVQVDLWYDASGCLVQQESQESSSHTARLELVRIIEE